MHAEGTKFTDLVSAGTLRGPRTYDIRENREHADALADARPLSPRTPGGPRSPLPAAATSTSAAAAAKGKEKEKEKEKARKGPRGALLRLLLLLLLLSAG